jgi:hypothetical protein
MHEQQARCRAPGNMAPDLWGLPVVHAAFTDHCGNLLAVSKAG